MIDLTEVLKKFYLHRRLVLRNIMIFSILGIIIALISEKDYKAETSFLTDNRSGGSFDSGLSGLAGLAGFNLSQLGADSDIPLMVYPDIVESKAYREALLNTKLYKPDFADSLSYMEYYDSLYTSSPLAIVREYTIGLPVLILDLVKSKTDTEPLNLANDPQIKAFSFQVEEHMKRLGDQLFVELAVDKNLVSLTFVMDDPLLAAQMLQSAKSLLQDFLIAFQIKKAKNEYDFTQKLYLEKEQGYKTAQVALATFEDSNKSIATSKAVLELDRLQREKDLSFEVFSEISKQLEQVKLKLKKDTPIFSTIEPLTVPVNATAPKKILVVLSWLIIGMVFTGIYIFWFENLKSLIRTVKESN